MKVLVADDDLGSRLVAQSTVQRMGHECAVAADGDAAWELVTQWRPDVLITDRDMPGLDGIALCRRIREHTRDTYTYVVLLTSLDDPDDVAAGMRAGADDYLPKPLDPFVLQMRLLAASRVTALHEDLARVRGALARQAHTDPMTGLRNRLSLVADLEQLHDVSQRYDRSYCVAMCDVDFFKSYNDTYGHPAGDLALRSVAGVLTDQVGKGDRVYRYGGEEFLVLLPEQDLDEARITLDTIRSQVDALAIENRGVGPVAVLTMSVGIAASRPGHRLHSADVVAEADTALYEAKRTGRNRTILAGSPVPTPRAAHGVAKPG